MPDSANHDSNTAGRFTLATGAVASVSFTAYVGRANPSALLIAMFIGWVLTPFAALAVADAKAADWNEASRSLLSTLTLIVAAASICVYGYVAFGHPRIKPAAPFLILPPILLAFIGVFLVIVAHKRRQ